jgi:hypothetical protein
MPAGNIFRISLALSLAAFSLNISAQGVSPKPKEVGLIKHKKCLLKGRWQLIQTYSLGSLHKVSKDEYDGVITFGTFHRYKEEVRYESNHWVITGKWKVYKKKATLLLTQRQYVMGQLDQNQPEDITFELINLDPKNWSAGSVANGKPVQVSYRKITGK